MSVPRPAMLVATVTAPLWPASATIFGLVVVLLGVQHGVRDALALRQQPGQQLGLLHRHGADQDRLAVLVPLGDVVDDGDVLRLLGAVDQVGLVDAGQRLVGRDRHHAELVDLVELRRLGHRRAGHAGELVVEAEVVLQGDRREGLVLLADLDALLGLDRLVQALVVAAAGEHAAGVLVDDQHLAVHDDVLLVVAEQLLGLDRVVHERDQRGVHRVVEVVDAEVVLDLGDARLEDGDGALLLVDLVVDVLDHRARRWWRTRRTSGTSSWVGPEMISGVRASSMRIESTSSTIAKLWPRWTQSSMELAMLSRR